MSVGPDLASMIASAAQGGAPQGAPQGGEKDAVQILQQMIDLAMQYQQVEPDPGDRATMAKIVATLRQYEAKDQKEADAALGVSPAVSFLRNQRQG